MVYVEGLPASSQTYFQPSKTNQKDNKFELALREAVIDKVTKISKFHKGLSEDYTKIDTKTLLEGIANLIADHYGTFDSLIETEFMKAGKPVLGLEVTKPESSQETSSFVSGMNKSFNLLTKALTTLENKIATTQKQLKTIQTELDHPQTLSGIKELFYKMCRGYKSVKKRHLEKQFHSLNIKHDQIQDFYESFIFPFTWSIFLDRLFSKELKPSEWDYTKRVLLYYYSSGQFFIYGNKDLNSSGNNRMKERNVTMAKTISCHFSKQKTEFKEPLILFGAFHCLEEDNNGILQLLSKDGFKIEKYNYATSQFDKISVDEELKKEKSLSSWM